MSISKAQRAELDRLSAKGLLHTKDVIAAARDRSNALHEWFDWDKTRAIQRDLEAQARSLIGEYMVTFEYADKRIEHRHFVSLRSDRASGGGYRKITDVM